MFEADAPAHPIRTLPVLAVAHLPALVYAAGERVHPRSGRLWDGRPRMNWRPFSRFPTIYPPYISASLHPRPQRATVALCLACYASSLDKIACFSGLVAQGRMQPFQRKEKARAMPGQFGAVKGGV